MTAEWRVRVAETLTGRIVAEVQPASLPTFTRELCAKGDWGVQLITNSKLHQSLDLKVYATSNMYCWIIDCDGYIVQAGPVTSAKFNESDRKLDVSGIGLAGLFDQRALRNPEGDPTKIADASNDLKYTGLSLRGIFRKVVEDNLVQEHYALPIVLPDSEEGDHEREYHGYELAKVWDRLTELSEVIDGPEFDFAPEYYMNGSVLSVRWRLKLGNPQLGDNELLAAWDYGGALGTVDVDVNAATGPVHRAWVKGSGDKNEMKSGYAENTDELAELGYPGTDYINNDHATAEEDDTLVKWAEADIEAYAYPNESWSASVRIDGLSKSGAPVSPALGSWDIGDAPLFRFSGHPWIPNGVYRRRIIGYSSDTDSTVTLKIQDQPFII